MREATVIVGRLGWAKRNPTIHSYPTSSSNWISQPTP